MTVQQIIDEIQAESVIDLADATLLNHFKSGLRYISSLIEERIFLSESTLTLAINTQSIALTGLTGFIKERSIWYVSDGARVPISRPPSTEYFHDIYTTTGVGKPSYYKIDGQTIRFDKLADSALTIGFDYFKEISSVALIDTFVGDERLIQAAKYACKAEYYGDYEEDEMKAARNEKKCKEILMMLQGDYEVAEHGGYVNETE